MQNVRLSSPATPVSFQSMFCEAFHCTPEKAKQRMFWLSLHRRAWPIAGFLKLFRPRFFSLDYQLLDEAASAANINELVMAINGYLQDCAATRRFVHDDLRLRISGKRLISVFKKAKARIRSA
jgi:hypothetical protein